MGRRRIAGTGTEQPTASAEARTVEMFDKGVVPGVSAAFEKAPARVYLDTADVLRVVCVCGQDSNIDVWAQWKYRCEKCSTLLALTAIMDGEAAAQRLSKSACVICTKAALRTAIGPVFSCGHSQTETKPTDAAVVDALSTPLKGDVMGPPPQRFKAATPPLNPAHVSHEQVTNNVHAAPPVETVTVTWAREAYQPKQYHMCEVGPFTETTALQPGESRAQARDRLYKDLTKFAEGERDRKLAAMIAAIRQA